MIAAGTLRGELLSTLARIGELDVNYQETRELLHKRALFLQREINELEKS